jgi:hypothetical protein
MEIRSLRNARQRLIDFRLIENDDTTWILKYDQHGTRGSGIYQINYELLELFDFGKFGNQYFRNDGISENLVTKNADLSQNSDLSLQNTHYSLEQNETKQNSSSSRTISSNKITNSKIKKAEEDEEEIILTDEDLASSDRARRFIEKQYKNFFIQNHSRGFPEAKRKWLIDIGNPKWSDKQIEEAVLKAVRGTNNNAYLIENIYNNLNGNNGSSKAPPEKTESPEEIERRRKIEEANEEQRRKRMEYVKILKEREAKNG